MSAGAELRAPARRRETLEERAARLAVSQRSCSDCTLFEPSRTGLAFGWCRAHEQHVKLAHGAFWSQCQFKTLSRVCQAESNGAAATPQQ